MRYIYIVRNWHWWYKLVNRTIGRWVVVLDKQSVVEYYLLKMRAGRVQ